MSFEWTRKDKYDKIVEIRKGREPNTGYSDHFQIQGVIKIAIFFTVISAVVEYIYILILD